MTHTIDAKDQKLGRLASRIAHILQGKLHADYEPRLTGEDRIVIKNVDKIVVSGRKATQKIYYRHTGYMGHLRKRTYKQFFEKSPEAVLRLSVQRMLPQNWLRDKRLKNLIIE
ncbi:MAG: 50S ribosomal protein L13 [Patescibacteria group bacterium]